MSLGPTGTFTIGRYTVTFDEHGYAIRIDPAMPDVNHLRAISMRVDRAYAMRTGDPSEWSRRVREELSGDITHEEVEQGR